MQGLNEVLNEIRNRPVADDLIQDLLPDSASAYMLIVGRSGIGKTFLALQLLYCLATGTPFLSHKTKECKVGYLSMEGSDLKIATRFETLARSFPQCNGNIAWKHTTAIKLSSDGFSQLEEIITGQEVVIVDTLRYLVAGDYTSPKDANLFLERLQKLQNATSTRFILLHHIRKPDKRIKIHPEDLQFEVKGATEYVEGANTVLLLERATQGRDTKGQYFVSSSDNKMLYFSKVKDSPTDKRPIPLHFNRVSMLLEPVTAFYDEEEDD